MRVAFAGILFGMAAVSVGSAPQPRPLPAVDIDHVILSINRLETGIEEFTRLTGVVPERGGEHPGRGTQNALVALGAGRYLEIIAPTPSSPRPAGIPFTRLTPSGWALHSTDLGAIVERLRAAGLGVTGPTPGSRRRPDGTLLEWQTAGVSGADLELAPFFIRWGAGTRHPSTTSPGGCRLETLELLVPRPAQLQRVFDTVGFKATLRAGERAMHLTLECPKGRVTFGS